MICGQARAEHLRKQDSVVTRDAHVFRNRDALPFQLVHAADKGKIVRVEDAGWPIAERKQLSRGEPAELRVMVQSRFDIVFRHLDAETRAGFVKADESLLRNGRIFAVDKGDFAMTHFVEIMHQCGDAADVIRKHGSAVVVDKIERNGRYFACDELQHRWIGKIDRGNDHAVAIAIFRVLIIVHLKFANVFADKCDVVAEPL